MKNLILIISALLISILAFSQQKEKLNVEWKTVEEVGKLFAQTQKPVLFFIYSNKNDSSLMMLDSIFSNPEVSNYINVLFYPVKIEADTKETITFFDNTTYTFNASTGRHGIIDFLTGGMPYYPSMVCFNRKAQGSVFQGFKNRDAIFPILTYYAEDISNSTTYDEYYKNYIIAYPPGKTQTMTRVLVRWKEFEEAFEQNKTNPKKLFIDVNNNYKVSCTVMMLATYNHPKIAAYLNEHFYPIRLNAMSNDTINAWGSEFVNKNEGHPYHSLAVALMDGKMQFPAIVFFNEDGKFIHRQNEFMSPEKLEAWLVYIASNKFMETTFDEFLKTFKTEMFKE